MFSRCVRYLINLNYVMCFQTPFDNKLIICFDRSMFYIYHSSARIYTIYISSNNIDFKFNNIEGY